MHEFLDDSYLLQLKCKSDHPGVGYGFSLLVVPNLQSLYPLLVQQDWYLVL